MRYYWIKLDLLPILRRRRDLKTQRRNREEGQVKMDAGIKVLCLQGRPAPVQARQEHGPDRSLEPSEEAWPCRHLDFGLLASRTVRINFQCFKLASCWYFVAATLGNQDRTVTLKKGG